MLVGVEGLLVAFVFRYRRRRRARDADGPQIHGSSRLETMWTMIPVVILVAVAAFVFVKLPGIKNVPSANAAAGRLEVAVKGSSSSGSSRTRTARSRSTGCACRSASRST